MSLYKGSWFIEMCKREMYTPILVSVVSKSNVAYPVDIFLHNHNKRDVKYIYAGLPSVHADIFQCKGKIRDNNLYFLNS